MMFADDVKTNIKQLQEIKNQLASFLHIFIQNLI